MTLYVDHSLENATEIEVAVSIVNDSAAAVVLGSAESTGIDQHTGRIVGGHKHISVERVSIMATAQVDVRTAQLRSGNGHRLCRCSIYVSNQTCNCDFTVQADRDFDCVSFVAADLICPFCVAVTVVLDDKRIIGIIDGTLNWTTEACDG